MALDSLCSFWPRDYTGGLFRCNLHRQGCFDAICIARVINKGIVMARVCQSCGKRTRVGNSVKTRGKPKHLGGVGTKITGITRRKFKPNLQSVKAMAEDGTTRSVRVCTQCLRSGVIERAVKRRAFELTS